MMSSLHHHYYFVIDVELISLLFYHNSFNSSSPYIIVQRLIIIADTNTQKQFNFADYKVKQITVCQDTQFLHTYVIKRFKTVRRTSTIA